MFSKIKEAGRQVARSNSVSNDSRPGNLESQYYTTHIADKRRYSVAVTDALRSLQHSPVPSKAKMDRRPPMRKRGSSLFNKMTSQETYESLVPRSTSSSRLSERTITDTRDNNNRDSGFSSLSTRIKAHRMRKNSQLSLSLGPLEESEVRYPNNPSHQPRAPPQLLRTHSVPDLLSRSQAMSPDSRTFCNGKPISNPFNFRHLSHMETRQTAEMENTPEDILPLQWNSIVRESRAPKTPVVPLTPLGHRSVRHMQSLSGSLRTTGLPMPSPSIESVYSPVDSIADLSMKSKSAESLTNAFASHLTPPPRSSSRAAFTGIMPQRDEDVPILEGEGRDSMIFLQNDLAALSMTVAPILEEEPSILDQEVEDDVLGAFPSPPTTSTWPRTQRSSAPQPNIVINNQLLPPLSPLRPSSSSSGTLGLGTVETGTPKEHPAQKRSSKRVSKRISRRVSILGDAQAEIQSWEADIDWTYDNNGLDEWVDDLEGIEEEEEVDSCLGSKSAPVSASPSAVNLAILGAKRYSDEGKSFLAAPEEEDEEEFTKTPEIGVADGGFGIFDHADRQYNAFGHQRQLSKTRNGVSQRSLSTCASLPNLKASRKHYRNSSLRGFSNLDNGIVTLDEAEELQHPAFQRTHSAPREVAIPPARYSGRSRAASNATCTTLVSDIEGYPSDLSEMASTPSHSSHNSAEGPYFFPQTQDGLFLDGKAHLASSVHIVNDEVPFNFF